MKTSIALAALLFLIVKISAQDSTQWNISLDIEGSGLHLFAITNSKEIRIDKEIFRSRRIFNPFKPFQTVSDNPHLHFATYAGLKFNTSFQKKYQIQTNLFVEDRGASYGQNDRNNLVVYPRISFLIIDTLNVFGHHFELDFKMGHLLQHQIDNGLRIYNIDDQAVDYKVSYKNFFYRYNQIGDLSFGIGLDIEEVFNNAVGYENKDFRISISREWNSMTSRSPIESYQVWNLSGNYYMNKNIEIFFQIGNRYFENYNFKNNGAIILGANLGLLNNNKFTWSIFPKIKYYTANYNKGHFNPNVIYRNPNNSLYSNTVGRYLYPLRNYYYDFDQWAVFTEYQDQNILGLVFKNNFDWNIFNDFYFKTKLETLSIRRNQEFYTNLFYEIDFCYIPVKGLEIGGKMTNKSFNLDAHFQTFYMMKRPLVGLHIRLKGLNRSQSIFSK